MKKRKKVWFIAIPIILILGYLIYDGYSQPSLTSIPGQFEEVAFIRNEQNKGGIVRIYAVTVGNMTDAAYDVAADLFPINDYNSVTRIFFFDKNKPFPKELSLDPPYYDTTQYEAVHILKRTGTN
ncbi:hypothetical protein [Sphingobacterium rhinopitheci]|uniref:hypothetical protein n=1 Tax=Sphingobacterium rhinopitheci TaxID=2781960 RepID=UPI001F51FFCA|nr:hypothetical protein [Sphingobacterium rhinopitheci]MCI0919980.1 hypothetical protein [Sphingobacterium rhinopitheci]